MSRSSRVIVITGVPGTGKTALADSLEKRLRSVEVIRVNEVVSRKRLFSSYAKDGAKIVRMQKLRLELERLIKASDKKIVILEGHVLCDMKIKNARAIVLREHLKTIKRRLKSRGYATGKIDANIISEATDYCGTRAERNYGYVFEALASDSHTVASAMKIANGKEPANREIDLMPELQAMIKKDKTLIR